MAGNKYLKNLNGNLAEEAAVQSSAGAADANKIVALDANGKLDQTMMPTGIGADTAVILASENLAAGDNVNIYDNAGTANVRKADAATNKPAHGFVLAAVTSGQNATVYFEGTNNQVTGLTVGQQFLSATTPGASTATAPTAAGHIVQKVGIATSATSMNAEFGQSITLA